MSMPCLSPQYALNLHVCYTCNWVIDSSLCVTLLSASLWTNKPIEGLDITKSVKESCLTLHLTKPSVL